ncbi:MULTISPECIES: DUF1127 domain-containing protein [unclassified Yoonia]|uniref:DUF1127 domain-containing protein n=1 Tax=unclassified Yoonia TaxID=2629118 RepID=UPI002AFF2DC7|nr:MULTISPECIES: DUF1127 domain-containing protein [unclassified Yoonia]
MAFQTDNTLISTRELIIELALTPLRALGRGIVYLTENNSRAKTLRALSAISDEQLAARGLTRAEVVAMAFRHDI